MRLLKVTKSRQPTHNDCFHQHTQIFFSLDSQVRPSKIIFCAHFYSVTAQNLVRIGVGFGNWDTFYILATHEILTGQKFSHFPVTKRENAADCMEKW